MNVAKSFLALLVWCAPCAMFFGCGPSGDWRAQAIADAQEQVRVDVNDPDAKFSDIQVTGNSSTGQTCGRVSAKLNTGGDQEGRFIVYIDGNGGSGPYVENDMGKHPMSHEAFEFAWQNDCIKEGYKE
ncbi:MAG TPA: hypothetical protein VIM56_11430 [Rhizomicrobium sp.]